MVDAKRQGLLKDDGKRSDGRKFDQLRDIKIEAHVLNRADGSAYLEWGKNKILAAVYGPREVHPRYLQRTDRGIIQCRYHMAPFSVENRKRPGLDRRSTEISKVTTEAFDSVVLVKRFPRTSVDIYIEVLEASAGTRCAGITAASVALADAGIPMKDLLAACASGKVDGKVVLDLNKKEDNLGQADVPMAIIPNSGKIVLLQMDGDLTSDELEAAMDLNMEACKRIYDIQKDALKKRYSVVSSESANRAKDKEQVDEETIDPELVARGGDLDG